MFSPPIAALLLSRLPLGPAALPQESASTALGPRSAIVGEVVDLACRFEPTPGETHACTKECLREARLPALLDEESGRPYLVFDAARRAAKERLADLAGARVRVSGKIREGRGVRTIVMEALARAEGERPASAPARVVSGKPRPASFVATVVNAFDAVEAEADRRKHACTAKCAETEAPLGLLDETTGRLYLAIGAGRKSGRPLLQPFAGLKIRVTGRISGNVIELVRIEKG